MQFKSVRRQMRRRNLISSPVGDNTVFLRRSNSQKRRVNGKSVNAVKRWTVYGVGTPSPGETEE